MLPPSPQLERSAYFVPPLFNNWVSNPYKSPALTTHCDRLLGDLSSGEITIKEY